MMKERVRNTRGVFARGGCALAEVAACAITGSFLGSLAGLGVQLTSSPDSFFPQIIIGSVVGMWIGIGSGVLLARGEKVVIDSNI